MCGDLKMPWLRLEGYRIQTLFCVTPGGKKTADVRMNEMTLVCNKKANKMLQSKREIKPV